VTAKGKGVTAKGKGVTAKGTLEKGSALDARPPYRVAHRLVRLIGNCENLTLG
jgi:hypothetical protein